MTALPPWGSAIVLPQTVQSTRVVALLKMICSFWQSLHFTLMNLLLVVSIVFTL
jgi:hypothetical protein